ncbi:MAG: malonyl-CoA decarboxylase [Proteobacteria bacterium]|nr:malonyl-CoA decarboxylase [Pseudomonadota bacterium]
MDQNETLIERTLSNLAGAWREIAQSAARSVGRNDRLDAGADPKALEAFMRACLEARGGEVSARMRAAELGETYLELDAEGRRRFLETLAGAFAVDETALDAAIDDYRRAETPQAKLAAERRLRQATLPPRVKLLTQFNALPEGVKFLVDLRADLLALPDRGPALDGLDADLRELLASWFDTGFLDLARITWDSPAALLEKLIAYEAVHEIRSWDDLRHRVESDRHLYALFHPRMPEEPLAFVEVALVKGIARNVQALLDAKPDAKPDAADTAIFYSITNTQKGLRDISFGEYLIKRVVQRLAVELPRIKTFATLSPIPGLRAWLETAPREAFEQALSEAERGGVRALGGNDDPRAALAAILARDDWHNDPVVRKALEGPLLRLCARYFTERRENGEPIDPVARFHLRNGARLEHLNWLGDTSAQGLRRSAGLMANYRYVLAEMEKNHEAYMKDGRIAMSSEARSLIRSVTETGDGPLKRLGLG